MVFSPRQMRMQLVLAATFTKFACMGAMFPQLKAYGQLAPDGYCSDCRVLPGGLSWQWERVDR